MNLVKPSIEHLDVTTNPLKAIEIAGRTCYKSEDKITDDSAEKFVKMLIDRGHHAMIEHSMIVLTVSPTLYAEVLHTEDRPYLHMTNDDQGQGPLISGNPRAIRDFCMHPYGAHIQVKSAIALAASKVIPLLFEGMLQDHLSGVAQSRFIHASKWSCVNDLTVAERLQHQVASYKIICNRGVTHEIVRHRPPSYGQESTRFCNYKGGVAFIIPHWARNMKEGYDVVSYDDLSSYSFTEGAWLKGRLDDESLYKAMINSGQRPQDARDNLPIATKTEIVVTCNLQEWKHIFKMRCTPAKAPENELVNGIWCHATAPHPQMQEVANMILADMLIRVPGIFEKE